MATVAIKNQTGADSGQVELAEAVFGFEANPYSIRHALNIYLANQRRGTAKTKTRGEVSGGGSKPFRQKGTGRARQGSSRSPLMPGGATAFGPIPRSYRGKVNRRVRNAAIRSALSVRASENAIFVVDSLELPEIKTRLVAELLERLGLGGKNVLVIAESPNRNLVLGARNLPNVDVTPPQSLNVYDLLGHGTLLFSRASLEQVVEIFG
ncbi:MAG: 50S ribosomal protein L4 [candidate division BRC1 bacterium ADurb.BinA364]|nr:MAG: 50S ribosomal protein L4 [candidate division BRC1 bacterium ADurb.BinA364]